MNLQLRCKGTAYGHGAENEVMDFFSFLWITGVLMSSASWGLEWLNLSDRPGLEKLLPAYKQWDVPMCQRRWLKDARKITDRQACWVADLQGSVEAGPWCNWIAFCSTNRKLWAYTGVLVHGMADWEVKAFARLIRVLQLRHGCNISTVISSTAGQDEGIPCSSMRWHVHR